MQCEEFEDRLNAVLDTRARTECDAQLRLHAENCSECRHLLDAYNALLDGVCDWAVPQAPADLAQRVLAEIPVRSRPRRLAALAGATLATAAGLLVALVPLWQARRGDLPNSVAPRLLATSGPRGAAPAEAPDGLASEEAAALLASASLPILESLPEMVEDPQADPYRELLKGTGSGLAAIVLYVPGIGGTRGIIDAEANPADNDAWAGQMSEGLKPVTDSVSDTLNLLWRALPVADLASRS